MKTNYKVTEKEIIQKMQGHNEAVSVYFDNEQETVLITMKNTGKMAKYFPVIVKQHLNALKDLNLKLIAVTVSGAMKEVNLHCVEIKDE